MRIYQILTLFKFGLQWNAALLDLVGPFIALKMRRIRSVSPKLLLKL